MTNHKTKLASLLLLLPALAMAKTDVIDIVSEQNYPSSYIWKIDEDTTFTLSRYCDPKWDKGIFISYKESYCNNSVYVRSTMANDSRTSFGHSYFVTVSNGKLGVRTNTDFNRIDYKKENDLIQSMLGESDPIVSVSGYGKIPDDKLIKLDGLKPTFHGEYDKYPTYSVKKSVKLVGFNNAYNAIQGAAKAEFDAKYDAQNQERALILILIAIAVFGGGCGIWKYVVKPSVNKISKTRKEVTDKLEKNKVRKIAKEEAIRQTVRTTIENDNTAISALKAQIKEALDNDDAKTAKILMEALEKMESKD
ncbi:hypothetical protein BCU68_13785 [Vibrio sp. 10N.286.49.B3]|uniref:hypothetical protein n=1 Tax=Vibrio sp. 10N.286.49.B3 TaxID=1880855 RepID=UPI000C85619B|nr:hypothetical protein [Vibrio sp. 10N.286.49.B3]PMH42662.1 hypothetical protein BCU68_13785 [Vibrio sp. 10N.286.49.B3]